MKRIAQPRIIKVSDRIEIAYFQGEYSLFVDAEFIGCYRSQAQAEHDGMMRIEEEANALAQGAKRAA